jgi:tape measure domain-containing protein
MEVAALGLRVDGADGIERARDALGRFTKASEGAERSTEKLGKGGRKAAEGISEADRAAAKASKSLAAMYTDAMRTAKGLVGLFALRQLQQFADGWSDMQSVVGASIGDMAGAGDMMGRLVDIANASYSPLSQTVDVYSRNVSVLKDLGKNAAQAADFTESLNHMLVLTATRGERAASVQNALSKAMAVGKLDAMGLETVLANGGEVAQALAKELNTTVNGLRAFASQGKFTGRVIADSVIKPLDDVRERAAEMPATLGDAFTRINTNLTEFVGKIDKASGASGALAEAVLGFADGIRKAGDYVVSFGQYAVPVYQGLASVLAFVAENADLAVVAMAGFYAPRIISGLWAARSSVVALAVALKTNLVSGITAVNAALAANALGIFISALSIAAYTVYSAFSDAKKGADALAKSLGDIESPLELVVERFNKLSKDQQAGKLVEYTQALEEAAKKADTSFSKLLTEVQGINLIRFGVPRAELDSVVERLEAARTSGEALSPILSGFATKFGIPRSALDDWITYAKNMDDANDTAKSMGVRLDAVNRSLAALATPVNIAPRGIEKWDEYLKKLTDARDVIGMSARQLGVFEAAQAGANSVQREMAGVITAQTDAFKKLQTAIEGKDKKAAEAAKNNIRALDVERQKVELLAIKTQALIAATNAFARG